MGSNPTGSTISRRKGRTGLNLDDRTMKERRHFIHLMATCAGCGREYKSEQETSPPRGDLNLIRLPLRAIIFALAALFIMGSLIGLGTNVISNFANGDFSLATLALSALFVVILVLIIVLLRNWRRSHSFSRYCSDCAFEMLRP